MKLSGEGSVVSMGGAQAGPCGGLSGCAPPKWGSKGRAVRTSEAKGSLVGAPWVTSSSGSKIGAPEATGWGSALCGARSPPGASGRPHAPRGASRPGLRCCLGCVERPGLLVLGCGAGVRAGAAAGLTAVPQPKAMQACGVGVIWVRAVVGGRAGVQARVELPGGVGRRGGGRGVGPRRGGPGELLSGRPLTAAARQKCIQCAFTLK
jgi:hypothetical protein